jgi:hypothetical protein
MKQNKHPLRGHSQHTDAVLHVKHTSRFQCGNVLHALLSFHMFFCPRMKNNVCGVPHQPKHAHERHTKEAYRSSSNNENSSKHLLRSSIFEVMLPFSLQSDVFSRHDEMRMKGKNLRGEDISLFGGRIWGLSLSL